MAHEPAAGHLPVDALAPGLLANPAAAAFAADQLKGREVLGMFMQLYKTAGSQRHWKGQQLAWAGHHWKCLVHLPQATAVILQWFLPRGEVPLDFLRFEVLVC
ncbi:MAG: hypothetical protein RLZZ158_871 [Cyanobacteriota bacterium]